MNTRLKWVALKAFRSFVDRTVIEFPASGIDLIRGHNLDSGGSSGSGKSSVNLAIAYALGICHLPATNLQSWLTADPMSVELCLDTPEGEVVVTRGEKLSLSINGEVLKGSVKLLEDKLYQILGLHPDLLEALTYRRQQTRGQFLSRTNSEKQEFLTVLMGLGKFEKAASETKEHIADLEPIANYHLEEVKRCQDEAVRIKDAANAVEDVLDESKFSAAVVVKEEKIKNLEYTIQFKKTAISQIEKDIQVQTDRIIQENMPILNYLEQAVKDCQSAPLQEPDRSEEVRLNDLLEQAKEHLKQAVVEDITTHEVEQKAARKLQKELDATRREMDELEQKRARGRDLLSQITVLETNVCFNCLQPWQQALDQKQHLEAEMAEIANVLEERQLEAIPSRIKRLEEEVQTAWKHTPNPDIKRLEGIKGQLMHQCADVEQYNHYLLMTSQSEHDAEVAFAKAELESTRSSALKAAQDHQGNATERLMDSREEVEALQNTLRNAYSELQACKSDANSVYMKNASIRQRAEANVRAVQDAEKRLEGARKRAEEYQGKLTAEKDFLLLVGPQGFLCSIWDEILWEISDETNRILGSIPNTTHVTISFRSETVTQQKTIHKEIAPVCKINGHETPIKSGCSGGMYSAIELAVDLAVSTVVSYRTGVTPGWVILDEAFDGLGVREKEGCLEILQLYAADKLVLIVDHASEINGAFSQTVDIEYRDGTSKIVERAS